MTFSVFAALASGICSAAAADCALKRFTSIETVPTTNGSMLVPVKIGDSQRLLLLDTGGAISGVTAAAAQDLGLETRQGNIELIGVNGAVSKRYTVIPSLTVGTVEAKDFKVMILPGNIMPTSDLRLVGTMAPNPALDLELDFTANKFSLFSPDHCSGKVVYWPATAVAAVPMKPAVFGHIVISVKLDGKEMDALVDTGASKTFLDLKVAEARFDVKRDGPDVEPVGEFSDNPAMKVYRRRFGTLSFEGVTITNPDVLMMDEQMTRSIPRTLRTGTIIPERPRGLPALTLGMSVLSKTHMYVSYRERKLYITPAAPQGASPAQ